MTDNCHQLNRWICNWKQNYPWSTSQKHIQTLSRLSGGILLKLKRSNWAVLPATETLPEFIIQNWKLGVNRAGNIIYLTLFINLFTLSVTLHSSSGEIRNNSIWRGSSHRSIWSSTLGKLSLTLANCPTKCQRTGGASRSPVRPNTVTHHTRGCSITWRSIQVQASAS